MLPTIGFLSKNSLNTLVLNRE